MKRRLIAQDAMGVVASVSFPADAPPEQMRQALGTEWGQTPTDEVAALVDDLAEWLIGEGWPDPRGRGVRIADDGSWREWDGTFGTGVRLAQAAGYILERAGPLSMAGYAARIFHDATAVLAAHASGDMDGLLYRAQALGALRAQAEARHRFLAAVTRGKKVQAGVRAAGAAKAAQDRPLREKRLQRMQELVARRGVSRAAELCEAEGLGRAAAIRPQWYRSRPRK